MAIGKEAVLAQLYFWIPVLLLVAFFLAMRFFILPYLRKHYLLSGVLSIVMPLATAWSYYSGHNSMMIAYFSLMSGFIVATLYQMFFVYLLEAHQEVAENRPLGRSG